MCPQPLTENNRFSIEEIARILQGRGLISELQAKKLVAGKDSIFKRFQEDAPDSILLPAVAVAGLRLPRADNPRILLDEDALFEALAAEWGIEFRKVDPLKLDLNLVTSQIPHSFAKRHLVLPIGRGEKRLLVATPNPFNREVLEDIARATRLEVVPYVSPPGDIRRLIDEFYGFKRSIAAASDQFSSPLVDLGNLEQYVRLGTSEEIASDDRHIVTAVNHLFSYAFDQRASDIHLEPKRDVTRVRMRIDGMLHTVYELPKSVHTAIVSRIKNLSRLDMAEKRKPQDGRIKTSKGEVEAEVRVSTLPVAFGEKVVMRIMDPDILFQDLETLGFYPSDLIRYNRIIKRPHGLVLVCGPTGSGKTTTLYSTLKYLSSPEINITTIEDPIEMISGDFNQAGVAPAIGNTFSALLKHILRQDPDIIMIGEMRDAETAENAIQAALTGHLVFSTLHTNDAPSAITRLLDIKVPWYLIKSSLAGVTAQRLVRTICPFCKESYMMASDELKEMGFEIEGGRRVPLFMGKGCRKCRGTGYLGRTGIFEVMPFDDSLKLGRDDFTDTDSIMKAATGEGLVRLKSNGLKKVLEGLTTYQEVLRVI